MSSKTRDILNEMSFGKIPPQSIDIEEAILGAIMIEKEMLFQVIDDLAPEKFYKEIHQLIYKAITQLWEANNPIDILTVTNQLKKNGDLDTVGGPVVITQLSSRVSTAINIEYYVKILNQKWIQRELIRLSSDINKTSYDENVDIADTIGNSISKFTDLMNFAVKGNTVHISEPSKENIKIIEDCMSGKITLIGIPTKIKQLDEYCNGLQKSDLIIIAGRPSMGKTALMASIVYNIAVDGDALVVIFSLEMSKRQIDLRLKIIGTEIESNKIIKSKIDRYDFDKIVIESRKIEKAKIFIDDTPGLNINEIWARLKRLSIEHQISAVFIDYIQLMTSSYVKGRNREQEVSEVSRGLKNIAREFDIPVVALAQLNRMVELTQNQRPKLSHLRECLSSETSLLFSQNNVLFNVPSRKYLLSLNQNNKFKDMNTENIPKEKGFVRRYRLRSGRFIDCTDNHFILTDSGYKKAKDITYKDSIAIVRKIEEPENTKYIKYSKFMGWMIGNGCMYGYNVPAFITSDKEVADEFIKISTELFGFVPKNHPHYKSKVYQYDITKHSVKTKEGNPTTTWLRDNDMWGFKAPDKNIPEWFINQANNKSISELLAGLIETDGSVEQGKAQRISYTTTSFILSIQFIWLCARLGIFCKIHKPYRTKKSNFDLYKILITDSEIDRFREIIKLTGKKGEILNNYKKSNQQNLFYDRLSLKNTKLLCDIAKKNGVDEEELGYRYQKKRISQKDLRKALSNYYKYSNIRIPELEKLINKNIIWDTLENCTDIGIVDVFDRYVEKTSNYIVNGIVVHNSGSLENDSDQVWLVHRPWKAGIKEFDDGKSTYNKAEIIVAKHRNGPIGDCIVGFKDNWMKFMNLEEMDGSQLDIPADLFNEDNGKEQNPF